MRVGAPTHRNAANLAAMARLAAALVTVVVALAPLPAAQAQIGPNLPTPLTEDPPPPPAPIEFDDGGLSTLQIVLIFGAAICVVSAIAFVIVRDSRRKAPVKERPRGQSRSAGHGAKGAGGAARAARERERQQRAKRQKAKQVRQQRRRNRPH